MSSTIKTHYKNLIIGFGKGGKTLAAWLGEQGEEVALIEKSDKMYGGSCINVACIPTKSLIKNAEEDWPYEKAFNQKNELTSLLRQKNYDKVNGLPGATVITGQASFVSPDKVRVSITGSDEETIIQADRIFVNTGSQPFIPSIPGIESSGKVFTSISLMEQSVLVKELIIIGSGYIGLEFADMYAKFGAKVTVLEAKGTFLPDEDRDVAEEIWKVLTGKGINILLNASVESIADRADGVALRYKNAEEKLVPLSASAILVATGRKPMTDGMNLEAAGIRTDKKGYIQVDEHLKTNVQNIWAIGDINGGPQFTYISLDDFRIIRDQLSGGEYISTKQRQYVASSVFITPPLAQVGLREKEAIEQGYRCKVAKMPAESVVRARIEGNTSGLLKTVVDLDTHAILGCTLYCVKAGEMINTIQVAMNGGMDYRAVRDTIYTHPSMCEAFNNLYSLI